MEYWASLYIRQQQTGLSGGAGLGGGVGVGVGAGVGVWVPEKKRQRREHSITESMPVRVKPPHHLPEHECTR